MAEQCGWTGCAIPECATFLWRWQRAGRPILALGRVGPRGAMAEPLRLVEDLPVWLHQQRDGEAALAVVVAELAAGRWFLPAQRQQLLAEWRRLASPPLRHKPGYVIGYLPAWFQTPAAVEDLPRVIAALTALGADVELPLWRHWRG